MGQFEERASEESARTTPTGAPLDNAAERKEEKTARRADDVAAPDEAKEGENTTSKLVGGSIGATGGIAAGVAVGTMAAGPVGTIVGALAGALGGWWAGRSAADALTGYDEEEDVYFKSMFDRAKARRAATAAAERTYDHARPAYQLGYVAGHNPDYQNKPFEDVEVDLQRAWSDDLRKQYGDWSDVREYVGDAYARRREREAEREGRAEP